ncbi:MAG: cysteine dioxygenase family protein [Chloroflexota bacterium]
MVAYSLKQMAVDVAGAIGGREADECARAVRPLLERFVLQTDALPPIYSTPRPDRYAQYLLHLSEDESFSIVSFVWNPSSTTPIHDHCVWGLVGVYQGQEHEVRFLRRDDGSDPHQAWIEPSGESTAGKGSVQLVLPPHDIHQVSNRSQEIAVSIHIYGCDIGRQRRHAFDLQTGAVSTFVSGYDHPGAPGA